jgi:uncharacterized protein YjiS (DUF1127 family)
MKIKGEKQVSTLHWTDHAVRPLTHRAAGLFALIAEWVRRSEKRRELAGLSGRELRDIGVTHGDAMREAQKPFWRA